MFTPHFFFPICVTQFEAAINKHDENEIRKLVDPRLGDDYPIDSVTKVKNT